MLYEPKHVLILSGGGGRGAFHAGVYKYLMSAQKIGVDAAHQEPWKPDIIVGTSIGAVNGAAIAQGITPSKLVEIWENLKEGDIQGLPPRMGPLARLIVGRLFGAVMGTDLPKVPEGVATSRESENFWPPLPLLPRFLGERLVGRWINLLDTGPLKQTLSSRFGIDQNKLGAPEAAALLIAATNVLTGEGVLFSNREVKDRNLGQARRDVFTGITADRILASCSIPLIYPWIHDEQANSFYWDGALVANTPLGAALDLIDDDLNVPVEVIVVMMTPWWESGTTPPETVKMPNSFDTAITRILDWMMLSSFRENLKMIDAYNKLADAYDRLIDAHKKLADLGYSQDIPKRKYRVVKPIIVAPKDFMHVDRLINYDRAEAKTFIAQGEEAAALAFQNAFRA